MKVTAVKSLKTSAPFTAQGLPQGQLGFDYILIGSRLGSYLLHMPNKMSAELEGDHQLSYIFAK